MSPQFHPPHRAPPAAAIAGLTDLGFTDLEARVYLAALASGPATGYALAKAIGKPVANTYKAIDSLLRRGAVQVEEGPTRRCVATAPEVLFAALERDRAARRARALEAIRAVTVAPADEAVVRIGTVAAVFAEADALVRGASTVVIVSAFPAPLAQIEPALRDAVDRGVAVGIMAYGPFALSGATVTVDPAAAEVRTLWPGEHLEVVADAEACLQAMLTHDGQGVIQAVRTRSRFLSCQAHASGTATFVMGRLLAGLSHGDDPPALRASLADLDRFRLRHAPGFEGLRALAARPIADADAPADTTDLGW